MIIIQSSKEGSQPHSSLSILEYAPHRTVAQALRIDNIAGISRKSITAFVVNVQIIEGTHP